MFFSRNEVKHMKTLQCSVSTVAQKGQTLTLKWIFLLFLYCRVEGGSPGCKKQSESLKTVKKNLIPNLTNLYTDFKVFLSKCLYLCVSLISLETLQLEMTFCD